VSEREILSLVGAAREYVQENTAPSRNIPRLKHAERRLLRELANFDARPSRISEIVLAPWQAPVTQADGEGA
jgi:hypothetical protein